MLNLSYENQFSSQVHSDANQTHFHMKGFALGLVLKQRQKATRKWPIDFYKVGSLKGHCRDLLVSLQKAKKALH